MKTSAFSAELVQSLTSLHSLQLLYTGEYRNYVSVSEAAQQSQSFNFIQQCRAHKIPVQHLKLDGFSIDDSALSDLPFVQLQKLTLKACEGGDVPACIDTYIPKIAEAQPQCQIHCLSLVGKEDAQFLGQTNSSTQIACMSHAALMLTLEIECVHVETFQLYADSESMYQPEDSKLRHFRLAQHDDFWESEIDDLELEEDEVPDHNHTHWIELFLERHPAIETLDIELEFEMSESLYEALQGMKHLKTLKLARCEWGEHEPAGLSALVIDPDFKPYYAS